MPAVKHGQLTVVMGVAVNVEEVQQVSSPAAVRRGQRRERSPSEARRRGVDVAYTSPQLVKCRPQSSIA
jgi:hypothetical protein